MGCQQRSPAFQAGVVSLTRNVHGILTAIIFLLKQLYELGECNWFVVAWETVRAAHT